MPGVYKHYMVSMSEIMTDELSNERSYPCYKSCCGQVKLIVMKDRVLLQAVDGNRIREST